MSAAVAAEPHAGAQDRLGRSFVLPSDVLVFPVTELAERVRAELDCEDEDFAVTRPGFRSLSRIVDAGTAALLEEFRHPSLIADAVVRFSRARRLDPEKLLEEAFPVLQAFSAALLLVPEDSPWAQGAGASFGIGQVVAGYEVRRLIQALEDTELYQARDTDGQVVALKIARPEPSAETRQMLEREAAILEHLDGACCPRLTASGTYRGRPFLAIEWHAGVSIGARAQELRAGSAPRWRRDLHRLAWKVLAAYRTLHDHGVVHGDVHPGNILVDADDEVVLLDFGLSRFVETRPELDHRRRAGLGWYLDPETAAVLLRGELAPRASFAGEQYALAALIYFLICGEHYLDAPPEREALYREVLAGPMVPFARRGFESWPEVEAVLARAVAKRPAERFESLADFLDALRSASPPRPFAERCQPAPATELRRIADGILEPTARPGAVSEELFPTAPTASVQYGAAGLAWFLYRAAQLRDSPELLAAADLWSRRAVAQVQDSGAFHAPAVGVTEERVGRGSLYHRAGGVYCVHALVSQSRGDLRSAAAASEGFLEATAEDDGQAELAFGRSGALAGGALVLEAARGCSRLDAGPLAASLRTSTEDLWARLAELPAIGECPQLPHLGIAHGWAGILFAQLRVQQALAADPPPGLRERLEQLAARAEPVGRGVSWIGTVEHPGQESRTPSHAPGWCSGSAGHVFLWTLAHGVFGEARYLDLAEQAGWYAWEHPDRHPRLCCGLSGRAFALLRLYRHTGERQWLDRARQLATWSASALGGEAGADAPALRLYWGALGTAALAVELERPERSTMPVFDAEGWG